MTTFFQAFSIFVSLFLSVPQHVLVEALSLVQLHARRPETFSTVPPTCVVYHSQHKSAGRTIEATLGCQPLKGSGFSAKGWRPPEIGKHIGVCDNETWDCERQACNISKDWDYEPSQLTRIAYRGYTGTLVGSEDFGRPGDGRCVWATMAREPISRLLSAFYYCKYGWNKDPLCGNSRLEAANATIHQFAKHWGNYLFRELMWHDDLLKFAQKQKTFRFQHSCSNEPWLQFKDRLNGGDDPRTESGKANLEEVKKHLLGHASPLYDVFGVVEMWNETMAMFDDKMPLTDFTWADFTATFKASHGSDAWKAEEKRALEKAQKDPVLLSELAGDLDLYWSVIRPALKRRMKSVE